MLIDPRFKWKFQILHAKKNQQNLKAKHFKIFISQQRRKENKVDYSNYSTKSFSRKGTRTALNLVQKQSQLITRTISNEPKHINIIKNAKERNQSLIEEHMAEINTSPQEIESTQDNFLNIKINTDFRNPQLEQQEEPEEISENLQTCVNIQIDEKNKIEEYKTESISDDEPSER